MKPERSGDLYALYAFHNGSQEAVIKFDTQGNYNVFASGWDAGGSTSNYGDIATAPNGWLYAASSDTRRVYEINPEPGTLALLALGSLTLRKKR